ncbi:MAG: hypothetical protein HOB98_04290 [Gammaproteobacteria bacterium]|jgi:hypothetical protein|nr:hypothetical protein [Gammaproteobacteria bacterium]MBT3870266.1 hypothetical protein [Gammaproteobacteria bacterium]MBT4381461.1 hypothetical protein [Gammaproteobacteria bacterium]MBT4615649.1 hypothetical protein [Gammaproteobacteria bacterium]MBT5196718.1 hypothetical protein [Gammaproteobacteria bacterium]
MTIDELGSLGEFIGSIIVLLSLVYLALEIRSNTETARTSTYQSVVSEFGALNRSMASTPGLSRLFASALEDFDSLDSEEKARISQLFFVCFHNFENMYYQYKKGYLEDEVWTGWKRLMLSYHARPGFQAWWEIRRDVYSASFVKFLSSETLDVQMTSYFEMTGTPAD